MSAKALLREMTELIQAQTENVIKGDHKAVLDGAMRHEALLAALQQAPIDGSPEEMRALYAELNRAKEKLQSLLEAESVRVDFMLRLLLGGGGPATPGYPTGNRKRDGSSRMLNRRT
ncbi:MAG: hypothetical protein ACOY93_01765 [Bacillota bacterium]